MIAVIVTFFVFLALTILAVTAWQPILWGLSAWSIVSTPLGLLCAACAVVIFAQQSLAKRRLPPPTTGRTDGWVTVVMCTAAIVIFWLLRMRHDLWGERQTIAAAVEHDMLRRPGALLGTMLHWLVYRLMNATFLWDGTSTSILLSTLAGAGFVAAASSAARLFDREDGFDARGLAAMLIVSNGYIIVFFGCGGNAPVAALFAMLFMVSGLRFLRGEIPLTVPAILFPLAVFAHLPAVYLAPAFLYLLWRAVRSRDTRRQVAAAIGGFLACWVALEIVFTVILKGSGPARYLIALARGIVGTGSDLVYTDGVRHVLTAANGFLVLGPVSVAALVLLINRFAGRRNAGEWLREEERMLALSAAPAIILFLLAARRIDGGLRWDIFASAGPAFALYVLFALRRMTDGIGSFRRAAILLTSLGIFHIVPLIVCNVHTGTAERRLLSLPLDTGRGEFIMAERYFAREEYRRALEWYTAAIDKNEVNHAAHARRGTIYMKEEEYIDAVTSFLEAVELDPGNREYRLQLAEAYIAKNWLGEAIDTLETLTAEYPDSTRFWRRLGYARNHKGLYREAIYAYEKALELEPENEINVRNLTSAVLNRAAELQTAGNNEEARILYERAIQLYPADWRAFNNLAVMEMTQGNVDKALDILHGALSKHPFISQLNLNMGLILEQKGEDERALRFLLKSAELDPLHSGAGPHIERLEKKLGERNE
jgi:tetratricopeptide (TPR) repeat protein